MAILDRAAPAAHGPIAILGAGALGGYVGAMLSLAGVDVVLADSWPEHVDTVRQQGLRIESFGEVCVAHPPIIPMDDLARIARQPPRFVMVCVKLYDTERIVAELKRHWQPPVPVVTMQNGMVDDLVAGMIGAPYVLGGIAAGLNVALAGPGVIRRSSRRHAKKTVFQLGELDGVLTDRVRAISDILALVDDASPIDDLRSRRWQKLSMNSLITGVAALTGMPTAQIYRDPVVRQVVAHLGHESCAVGAALGLAATSVLGIGSATWLAATRGDRSAQTTLYAAFEAEAAKIEPDFKPGMLQDMQRGRPTEVDYFNGYIAKRGEDCGTAAPAHAAVAAGVRELCATGRPPSRSEITWLEPFTTT
jgi:2-dehydropantoate 2-reductase